MIVAHRTTVPDWLEAVGTVRAAQTSQIASQMMGNILEIRAQEGDRVQSGQVLATIDDSQPRAAVEQATAAVTAAEKEVSAAESDLALAEATLKRYQQLFDKKSVSPQEFDEIKARSPVRGSAARYGARRRSASERRARSGAHFARLHANSRAICRRGDGEKGRRRRAGFARHAPLHH